MRAEERFEYKGYVIEVLVSRHDSGKWAGSYALLKHGDPLLPGGEKALGLHDTILAAQEQALNFGKREIDQLITQIN